jgi:hypothetical protein
MAECKIGELKRVIPGPLYQEIELLRAAVRRLGEIADVCTFDDLREVCVNCDCERAAG